MSLTSLNHLLRNRAVILAALIGAAYLVGAQSASALPESPPKVPNGGVYSCGTCHQSGHSSGVPEFPEHSNAMQPHFLATTPTKTWTAVLAMLDSDGDGFSNGEELQDPAGAWVKGQPEPGTPAFVSNPSDSNPANNAGDYLATPPAPLVLDITNTGPPLPGSISFGVSLRAPLPIDRVVYTVKDSAGTTVYSFTSTTAPYVSGVWDATQIAGGDYTVTAQVVERRVVAGATPRSNARSEPLAGSSAPPACAPAGAGVAGPSLAGPAALHGVAAISAADVWAVGYLDPPEPTILGQTLIERWNGTNWSQVPSPSPGTTDNRLHGVAALNGSSAWAVGEHDIGAGPQTLILRWNGTNWSQVPSPNPGSGARLHGVAAAAADDAWAVGEADNGIATQAFIVRWNGTNWSTATIALPSGTTESSLRSIAAVAADDIWAVGNYQDGDGTLRKTLILHWDGDDWSAVASPNPTTFINGLHGVAAAHSGDVWAVGYSSDGGGNIPLTLHWDGAQWSIIASPNPGALNAELLGVAAAGGHVWAAGYAGTGSSAGQTLLLHWNGAGWSIVTRPGMGDKTLRGVAAVASGQAWAVGAVNDGGNPALTLAQRYQFTACPLTLNGSAISVDEDAGAATIGVTLRSTSVTTATVRYATGGGTAAAGADYTAASGMLTFAPGETSKTFTVPILDDTSDEVVETLIVTLSAPKGAALASPASATLTIVDDDGSALDRRVYLPLIRR